MPAAFAGALAASLHGPLRVGTIWVQDLQEPSPSITPLIPARFCPAEPDFAHALAAGMSPTSPSSAQREIDRRFTAGRRCYTAWAGERLAAYGWVSFCEEAIGEHNLRIQLRPCEAYVWDCFTLPEFRQKRLYSALLVYILSELRAGGGSVAIPAICRAWIGADFDNTPSQRGIDRAGFLRVADLLVWRLPALRLIWAQAYPGVPRDLLAEARRVFLGENLPGGIKVTGP